MSLQAMMHCRTVLLAAVSVAALSAQKLSTPELAKLIETKSPQLATALAASFPEDALKRGLASSRGAVTLWAIRSAGKPSIMIEGAPGPALQQAEGSDLWYATNKLNEGMSHRYLFMVDGKPHGQARDVAVYTADSFLKPGVTAGTLTEPLIHTSKIYDGMKTTYRVYTPAGYSSSTPAALMVWQDGHAAVNRESESFRVLDAIDNLTHEKKVPVIVYIFVSPGKIGEAQDGETYKFVKAYSDRSRRQLDDAMRSVEYDTVSDRYARFLRDELIPEVAAKYNIRKDAYSHAIAGHSSGAIAAFNVAWQQPELFSRVLSWNGTYTAIQPEPNFGGQAFPAMVRSEPKRNMRVWLQGSVEDNESRAGSWPLQNIAMANSLKLREYDFHFTYGTGGHNMVQGSAEFPESFIWIWRGYDPAKTEETFTIEPTEKAKPLFRVNVINRDHGPK
ncbi:MAG TPA: alpha/beta hydrolase-fold protein [Bryobacteraceae bacterium]|nr:alpha/beta hydrolase-fold protein [Bryobacteraceae bacterium]